MNILRQRGNTQVKLGYIACGVKSYAEQSEAKKF